ncbi:group II intron maturase-specific domain-containing protein, partial [Escherichia coli]|uniref:group II intron maturase-specific domain-containing protein n=1 Tax=Escherichia coli TaxID=562 RepID=UPI0025ACC841
IRRLTNRNWGVSMSYQLFKLRQYMQGWINYFGIANAYQGCVDLDHWIRRRVRMCYWRQWRKHGLRCRTYLNEVSGSKLPLLVDSQVKALGVVRKRQAYSKR